MMDFDNFFRCYKSNTLSWHTSKLEYANKKPSFIRVASCVFPDVNLVSNYHIYKEKRTKLLPYHSFYGCHIPPRNVKPPFVAVLLRKIQNHQHPQLAAFP